MAAMWSDAGALDGVIPNTPLSPSPEKIDRPEVCDEPAKVDVRVRPPANDRPVRAIRDPQPAVPRSAPIPDDEEERINFLHSLQILDTEEDSAFDDITKMLCTVFNVSIALVSLVDTHRQWFKSHAGLPSRETPRTSSFCAYMLSSSSPEMLMVRDACKDARFCDNTLVLGDPYIRFYCGAPLILKGHRLGSVCIIDPKPKEISKGEAALLVNFADIVASMIDKQINQAAEHDMVDNPSFLVNADFSEKARWPIMYMNRLGVELLNPLRTKKMVRFLDHFHMPHLEEQPKKFVTTETCMQRTTFGDGVGCSCVIYPVTRQRTAKDVNNTVVFPYTDMGSTIGLSDSDSDSSEGKQAALKLVFIVVKWDEKQQPKVETPEPGLWFPAPKYMQLLRGGEDFTTAIEAPTCVVMLASRFCGSCYRFAEFFSMICSATRNTKFCVACIDECPDIAAQLCVQAMPIPMVHFYRRGKLFDSVSGGSCAHFRQHLKGFLNNVDPSTLGAVPVMQKLSFPTHAPLPQSAPPPLPVPPPTGKGKGKSYAKCLIHSTWDAFSSIMYHRPKAWVRGTHRDQDDEMLTGSHFVLGPVTMDLCEQLRSTHIENQKQRGTNFGGSAPPVEVQARAEEQGAELALEPSRFAEPCAAPPAVADTPKPTETNDDPDVPICHYAGTVLVCLSPILVNSLVLVFGGVESDILEREMIAYGINAMRCRGAPPSRELVLKHQTDERPLVVIDVNDNWLPAYIQSSFLAVLNVLLPADVLVVMSRTNDFFHVLKLLSAQAGCVCTSPIASLGEYSTLAARRCVQ